MAATSLIDDSTFTLENRTVSTIQIQRTPFFENPLVPASEPTELENIVLVKALKVFSKRKTTDDISALEDYVQNNPTSPWRGSIYLAIGRESFIVGKFSKSLNAFAASWELLKTAERRDLKQIADRSLGELVKMEARLGRFENLERLFAESDKRKFLGSNTELIAAAKEGYWSMKNEPGVSFRCGSGALGNVLKCINPAHLYESVFYNAQSTKQGMSLLYLYYLSKKVGLQYQMARRKVGAAIIYPCVAHYKLNHYCAITKKLNEKFKIEDDTFGLNFSTYVSKETIDEEMSGYFLIPEGALPNGWDILNEDEAKQIWGKGGTAKSNTDATCSCDDKAKPSCGGSAGMATWNVHLMLVSLNIQDMPLGYTPPRGAPINIEVTYNQKEAGQPTDFNYFNLGHKWTFNWISYVAPNVGSNSYRLATTSGGAYLYKGYDSDPSKFYNEPLTNSALVMNSPNYFERIMPDGTKHIFDKPVGVGADQKTFLSKIIDPNGINAVTLDFYADGEDPLVPGLRLKSITDALGNKTLIFYEKNSNPYLVTKITDPYNRSCSFEYNQNNLLTKITDVLSLESSFTYDESGVNIDFITSMATPCGGISSDGHAHTVFEYAEGNTTDQIPNEARFYTLKITNPDNGIEIVQYIHQKKDENGNLIPLVTDEIEAPEGWDLTPNTSTYPFSNSFLKYRNTFYWDKKTIQEYPVISDTTKIPVEMYKYAKLYHYLHVNNTYETTDRYLESSKMPLENRDWFRYPYQDKENGVYMKFSSGFEGSLFQGPILSKMPAVIQRVVDDSEGIYTRTYINEHNSYGMLTKQTGAYGIKKSTGRITKYLYSDNDELHLQGIQQKNGPGDNDYDNISSFEYDAQFPFNLSKTINADRNATTFTYNQYGQIASTTNVLNETTQFYYDADGFLQEIELPLSGTDKRIRIEYDILNQKKINRIISVTDTEGFITKFAYDLFDRITQITYSDQTTQTYEYKFLDLVKVTSQAGHITQYDYNNIRQMVKMTNANGNAFEYNWCACGAVSSIRDITNSAITRFEHDIQGRLIRKLYPNGDVETYEYYSRSGLLKSKSSGKAQNNQPDYLQSQIQYNYGYDNNIMSVTYLLNKTYNAPDYQPAFYIASPGIRKYEYDSYYNRVSKIEGQFITTSYDYRPVIPTTNTVGALQILSIHTTINLPAQNDINEDWSAVSNYNTAIFTWQFIYDKLGRVDYKIVSGIQLNQGVEGNHFSYNEQLSFDKIGRVIAKTNNLGSFQFKYDGLSGRLLSINSGLNTEYEWQADIPRLKSITNIKNAATSQNYSKHEYVYDAEGNITKWTQTKEHLPVLQLGANENYDLVYDALGQLVSDTHNATYGGIPDVVKNEYVYDQINNRLSKTLTVLKNGSAETLVDTLSYNSSNQLTYVSPPLTSDTMQFIYDCKGASVEDQKNDYVRDAAGRISRIFYNRAYGGTERTDFFYDSFNRLIKIAEFKDNIETGYRIYLYCNDDLFVELTGGYNTRYYCNEGFEDYAERGTSQGAENKIHWTRNHLGSICEVIPGGGGFGAYNGIRYDYDMWGRRTSEQLSTDQTNELESVPFGFCGYFYHEKSGLYFTKFREYDTRAGRWLSRDPIGEDGGLNVYVYCGNNPVNMIDPFGLIECNFPGHTHNKLKTPLQCEEEETECKNQSLIFNGIPAIFLDPISKLILLLNKANYDQFCTQHKKICIKNPDPKTYDFWDRELRETIENIQDWWSHRYDLPTDIEYDNTNDPKCQQIPPFYRFAHF